MQLQFDFLTISTSFLGSYWIALGFDRLIMHCGYTDTVSGIIYYFVRMEYSHEVFVSVPRTEWFWVLLGSSVALGVIGGLVQWRFTATLQEKYVFIRMK